ncbi:MAG: putative polyketide biosynthesis enoyl-CoA hydratase PksH [Verrucomicrobia subdivision 3 bacterium]|nr:putative polyketide biosynthesis enoyl-CoA hydratase PksH [Limisphaerales bacterium]MCS1417596.1 putative polyketide biosynthesis enoyl-CoA hydratase PksH [Limisphaerales bacterium]UWK15758.1 LasR [uncultured Verrucomicrobiota bacterium]UWK15779.1 LasR [uncultured Verrucomicrobiota bacterium]
MSYQTIQWRVEEPVGFLRLNRPGAGNKINEALIEEAREALAGCPAGVFIIVLEGSPEVFCLGADFEGVGREPVLPEPGALYGLWEELALGPRVTIAHVRGRANAGGVGFVAACDIVIAEEAARFGLSELLFGLFPACVLPFLVRRVGFQKAHYLTLMTQSIDGLQAQAWGLADVCGPRSADLLRRHLLRLRRLSPLGVSRYKRYAGALGGGLREAGPRALRANQEVFSDAGNIEKIVRYVESGRFPWED